MKKINYNGSIAEDARLVKKNEWLSFTEGVLCGLMSYLLFKFPEVFTNYLVVFDQNFTFSLVAFSQTFTFIRSVLNFIDFGRIAIKRKGSTRRLNNLVSVVSDKKNCNIKDDIKVYEADLKIDNLQGYYEVPGDYIFIKNADGTSSIVREFSTADIDANVDLNEEYKHFLMDLRNSLELDKVIKELDNAGEFPIVGEIQKKELSL